ncbi:MAG: DUF2461 domain-containing protein [Chloroflexota bacterium]
MRDLAANNDKAWFEAHKDVYQTQLQAPAVDFVVALGERLQTLDPTILIDPRTNGQGNLMRIYRDVRFSQDKSPYKTAVAGIFWDGVGKKMQSPAFGFHMEADRLELMAGMFQFTKPQLTAYRESVADDTSGPELDAALKTIQSAGGYEIQGEQYKRVPQGFDPDHPRADLLRYKGLYAVPSGGVREGLSDPALVDVAFNHFRAMAPVYDWLKKNLT